MGPRNPRHLHKNFDPHQNLINPATLTKIWPTPPTNPHAHATHSTHTI